MPTVKVTYDSELNTLTFDPLDLNVALNPGDILTWDFKNVPSDCVPGILFDSAFGPLQALQVLGKSVVRGLGNLGTAGETYPYRAQLLDLNGVRTTSTQIAEVQNQVSILDTSPSVVMECQTTINPDTGKLEVTSQLVGSGDLSLSEGDTVIWRVSGVPFGFFVSFRFPADTDSSEDSTVGPFKSFLFTRGVGTESSVTVEAIGVGFNPPTGAVNPITYHIDVRDVFGNLATQQDPQIDNLGAPPQS